MSHDATIKPDDRIRSSKHVLDPNERISEVLFGLIMVLTFPTIHAPKPEPDLDTPAASRAGHAIKRSSHPRNSRKHCEPKSL